MFRPLDQLVLDRVAAEVQRELTARGLTRPADLPADALAACLARGIAAHGQERLFGGAAAGSQPFADTPENRALLVAHLLGYGPADAYLRQESLEELFIAGPAAFFAVYGRADDPAAPPPGKRLVPGYFVDDAAIIRTFKPKLEESGKVWDTAHPISDAVTRDGLRIQAVMPPAARHVSIAARRNRAIARFLPDLIGLDTLSPAMATFLSGAMKAGLNILVAGGGGSGKTTTANSLLLEVTDPDEHVVVIEAEPELAAAGPDYRDVVPHLTSLLTVGATADGPNAITQRLLVWAALRQRPTRVIIGELRGPEAFDWLQALNIGCDGSLTTIHANSGAHALTKLVHYALWAGEGLPVAQLVELIADTLHLVVFQRLERRTGIRRIVEICEVAGYAGGATPTLTPLFAWDPARRLYLRTPHWPRCAERLLERDLPTGLEPTDEASAAAD
jgi:pilus assembly protein CpaF